MNYKALGKNIKELRLRHGYTQKILAELIGIPYSRMSRIEQGKYEMDVKTFIKLSCFFRVSADLLLEGTD